MDNDAIADMFDSLGPVSIRRMFGGKGIYHRGIVLALEVDGEILLKADTESRAAFEAAGSRQWRPHSGKKKGAGKQVAMPYWSIPDAALDDPDEMALWVRLAWETALRAKS